MRDYGAVSPKFWFGKTGKQLRGNERAQLLALYLQTGPHSTMTGVYRCTVAYMAEDIGMPIEGASKALRTLCDLGFCSYDSETEEVFVHTMASFQIGERLEPRDNRCKAVVREVSNVLSEQLRRAFYAMYSVAFNIADPFQSEAENAGQSEPDRSPFEAPSKPRAGAGAGAGTRAGAGAGGVPAPDGANPAQQLPDEFQKFIKTERPDLDPLAMWGNFRDHYPQAERTLLRWKKWVRRERVPPAEPEARKGTGAGPPITVPSRPGRDAALVQLEADRKLAVPPPASVAALRAKLKQQPPSGENRREPHVTD